MSGGKSESKRRSIGTWGAYRIAKSRCGRGAVLTAVSAALTTVCGSSAFAADYLYTGGGTGTVSLPVTGNFSTGFTPAVSGATFSDLLRFNGNSTYTATNDLGTPVTINGFRVDGTPNLTVNSSAGSLIQLGGTNPFINFNNGTSTLAGPLIQSNIEFTTSGYIVKSSSPNFTADPIMAGGTLTFDAGTNNVIALADTGGDSNAELNISSSLVGTGNITLQNNVGGLNIGPTAIAALNNTADWGTLQLANNNSSYSGSFNIAYGRVVTGTSGAFGTGTLTIAIGSGNTSGGSLTLGGTSGAGGGNGNGGLTAGNGGLGAYGNLLPGQTGLTLPNAINLGGAINGDYGYAINNFAGINTLTGNINLTQTQIRIQSNTGNNMASNAGAGLIFIGNVSESVVGSGFNVSGNGDLTFSGTNTFTGGVNVSGGVLTFTNAGSLPATGNIYLGNAALNASAIFSSASAYLTSGRINNTSTGAVLLSANDSTNVDFTNFPTLGIGAVKGTTDTYSGTITANANGNIRVGGGGGTLNLATPVTGASNLVIGYAGAVGVVTLGASETYTGATNLSGGYLAVSSGQIPAGSQIIGFGGGIRLLDGAGTDFPSTRNIIDQGGLFLDTNGFNLTMNSPIIGGTNSTATGPVTVYGDFSKAGAGTLNIVNAVNVNTFYVRNTGTVYANGPSAVITNHNYTSLGVFPGDNVTVTLDNGAKYAGTGDFNLADTAGTAAYGSPTDSAVLNLQNTTNVTPVTSVTGTNVYIGKGADTSRSLAVGVINQGPNTNFSAAGYIWVGGYGQGTYNLMGGNLTLANTNLTVGRYPSAVGVVNVTGGTLNTGTGNIFLPEDGSGTLNVSAGATVTTNRIVLARSTDAVTATGVVNQFGGTVTTTGTGSAGGIFYGGTAQNNTINNPATGTYNLNGGLLKTGDVYTQTNANGAISSTFNFNGGTLQASSGANTPFIGGLTAANVLGGGAIINNGNQNITIAQNLNHGGTAPVDGGLQLLGTGVVTLSSTASTYTGPTQVMAGTTLRLAAASSTVNSINQSSIQAYYTFEDPNNPFFDSGPNAATNGTNSTNAIYQATDQNGNGLGNAQIVTTMAPPSSAKTGTHTGSLALNQSAYLTTSSTNVPTNFPVGNSAYTMSAWIYGSGNAAALNGYGIVGWGTYGTTNLTNAFRTTSTGSGSENGIDNYWWSNDLIGTVPGSTTSIVGNWNYVTCTYDPVANLRTLYVNGIAVAQDSPGVGVHNASSFNFAVGATNNYQEFFDGNMADLLITNSAFTAGQVQLAESGNLTGTLTTTTPGGQLPLSTTVQISSGATLDLNGNLQTIGGLTGPVGGSVNLGTGGFLTVANGVPNTYAGTFTNGSAGGLAVAGSSTLTIGSTTSTSIQVQSIGTVNVASGAVLALSNASLHAGRSVLVTNALAVSTAGTLDLSNNDLMLNGSSPSLSTVTAMVAAGYNLVGGGKWNGAGITSSAAASDSTHLTALGVIQNNQSGTAIYSASNLFDGIAPEANAVLVKYTYFGDANLDGKVDGSDYSLIDAGYSSHGTLSGWYNGDFNYDGTIDGSDYALLDNAYNNQGSQLTTPNALVAASTGQVAGASAVPEPASVALIAVATAGLVGRRRRR
jgi:fibronectin-binding autotransporter adhesin